MVAARGSTSAAFRNNFQRTNNGPFLMLRHFCFVLWWLLCIRQQYPTCTELAPNRKCTFTNCRESGTNFTRQKNTGCLISTLIPTNCQEHLNWPHRGPLKSVSTQLASQSIPQEYKGCSPELQSNPSVRLIRFLKKKKTHTGYWFENWK